MKDSKGYKSGGKVMRYDVGGLAGIPVIRASEGPIKRRPTPEEIAAGYKGLDIPEEDRIPKKKKKPVKKNMGGMMKYANGGKVRGAGMARRKRT